MEWFELLSNEDLKPKVEVTGSGDRLSIKIGRTIVDQLGWAPGPARLQFAEERGRTFVRIVRDDTADWHIQSAGKGGGLTIDAVQLAPSVAFECTMCVCDVERSGSIIISLPIGYALASQDMLKRRKAGKASTTKSSFVAA